MRKETGKCEADKNRSENVAIIILPVASEEYKKIVKVLNAEPPSTTIKS